MKFIGLLVIALTIFSVINADYIIDNFGTTIANGTDRVTLQPSRYFNGLNTPNLQQYVTYQFNNITNATTQIYPDLYLNTNYQPTGICFGGTRRIIIQSVTDQLNYAPTSGAGVYIGAGQLFSAVGPDLNAAVYVYYVGNYVPPQGNCTLPTILCSNQLALGPLLSTPIDITEGGIDQAMAFTIVFADSLVTQFTFTVYSNTTAFSVASRRSRARDAVDEDFEDNIMSYEVPLAQPITFANGKKATVGIRYIIPFRGGFAKPVAAANAADFSSVRGITFSIGAVLAADNIVMDFRTVPLVAETKQASIIETVTVDNVAEPGEIINYTLTVSVAQGIASTVSNIFVYDNPNKNYGSANYGTFLQNTVTLTSYQYYSVNCSGNSTNCAGSYTVDPTNFGAVIYNASNDPQFANRIAIFFPGISSGSYVTINYQVQIPNLPCAMQTCSSGCSFSTQPSVTGGSCYCQQNQARVCLAVGPNTTAQISRDIDASNNTNGIVDGCAPTTDVTTGNYLTVTPIGTTPNPALTIVANPTEKANGVYPGGSLTYTVTLTNNRTRSSDSFSVVFTPDQYAICTTGPNSPNPNFTSDATTGNPVYPVTGGLQYGQTIVFSITCTASSNVACGVNQTTMAAAINFGANTTNCPELTTADDFGSDFIPLIGAPSITLSKSNSTAITYGANANNVASFTINYANIGQRPATGVTITETIPTALTQYYQSTDNPSFASAGGNNYTYTLNLAANQSGSVSFLFRVPPTIGDCVTGNYINTVSSSAVCGASAITAVAYVGVNAVPDMAVTISNASTSVQPGQQVCYNVQYQNIGYRVAQSVVLSIVLPAFTNYSASGSANWVQSGTSNVYTLTVGNVNGQSSVASAQFCVIANSNTVCGSSFSTSVNVTTVCQNFPEQNLANNFAATTTTSIAGSVTLTLTKTATVNGAAVTSVNTGSTIVYTISGSNTGTSQAQNVTIVETLPSGVTAGSNNGFVAGSSGSYSFSVGNVNAGSSFGPYNFSVVVPSSVACPAPTITNTATVTETCTGATATSSATVTINAAPVLTLSAQSNNSITLSQTTQTCVSAVYGNTGTQTANNATLTLSYGPYLTPVSGANNGFVQSGNGVLTFNVGNLNVGASTSSPSACFIVANPIQCGVNSLNFTFVLTSPCAPNQAPTASTRVNIIANPVFTLTKTNSLNGAQASPGASVTYTITYANTGTQIANNTVLTENVPALFNPGNNPGWTCSGSTCTYNVGTLSPTQGTQTVTFSGSLTSNVPGTTNVQNTVTISSQPCAASATSTSLLTVAGYPNLVVSKSDGGAIVTPGDYIYYTITYSNNGDSFAPNTVLTDILPAFAVFNASLSTSGWSCPDGSGAGVACSVNVGTVSPGQSGSVSLVVKSDDWIRCGTNFTQNFVYIATSVQESNYNDNNASVVTPIVGEPDLIIAKYSNRTAGRANRVGPGELITYTIQYANVGVRDATNAVLYETVPEYTTFVASASSPQFNCPDGSPAGTVCTVAFNSSFYPDMSGMSLSSMSGGMSSMAGTMNGYGELNFTVRVETDLPPTAHITTNCASINNTCGECNPFDNMACYTVNLFGVPDLLINTTGSCRAIHWYLEWQNVGDQAASNVVLTDSVPAGTTFNAAESDARWSCNSNSGSVNFGQCTLNVGTVNSGAGGSAVFVTSPITGTTMDMFTNTGSIAGTGRNPDPTPQNNQDTATVGFNGCPDACDSCCPIANECCPDKTEVLFSFKGILQGIDQCSGSSSSSS